MSNTSKEKFCGSVLLSSNEWDKEKLINDLKNDWNIEISKEDLDEPNAIVSDINGFRIVISKFPAPVPNEEAEINAQNNYLWEDAVEVTKTHKAHIFVAIFDLENNKDLKDIALIHTKIMTSCAKQENAIGVFTSGVVFEPEYYINAADIINDDELPIFNWIWFGLYANDKGLSAYTYGMENFGKYELEILDTNEEFEKLLDFISLVASYVLAENVDFKDGDTIGFTKDDVNEITLSKGVALPEQDTLKISYKSKKKKFWNR